VVLLKLEALSTAKNIGKNMLGAMSAGCRASSIVERLAMAMVWRIES
jgi:predicted DNA repair protein MutK